MEGNHYLKDFIKYSSLNVLGMVALSCYILADTFFVSKGMGAEGLAALGCEVIPGEANFLLFRAPVPLLEPLRKQGILLRGCANFRGLGPQWYRAAVRRPEENQCLLGAIKTVVEETRT